MSRHSISADVEKSLRLMDRNASPAGKRVVGMSQKPQIRSHFAPAPGSFLDDSSIDQSFFGSLDRGHTRRDPDGSMTMHQWEFQNMNHTMTQNLTMIKGKDSWETVSDRLFVEFLETIQSGDSDQLLDTINGLIQTCTDNLGEMKAMQNKAAKKEGQSRDLWWLESERNTWRLMYCLYQHRANKPDHVERMSVDSVSTISEREVAEQLYAEDSATFECQLMIDWLERNALDQHLEGNMALPQHYTDRTVAWENTLHQLQNEHDEIPYRSSRPIVRHMDPDAPLREGRPIHDLDKEDEDRLVIQVFHEIRCGRLEEAQRLCVHCGQPWRAATLEGWQLHHDPNYRRPGAVEKLPAEGNPLRDIWKLCAWHMASDSRLPAHARATSAALCGHVGALLPVCRSWHDQLWARLKALVDIRVEQEIRQTITRPYQDMPQAYWQNNLSLDEIFAELSSSPDADVREEACQPVNLVQQLLILDSVPQLMREMRGWLDRGPHFLRFLAHLVLVLRRLGHGSCPEIGDAVLEAYVGVLISQGNPRLVAHYVGTLPVGDQARWYVAYLADVTEPEERQACLDAAEGAGLDVQAITKAVVEHIREQSSESSRGLADLKGDTSPEDLEKISALDWVVYYPAQREEALWQSNALIRHFLSANKVEAAKMALNKIPGDSIELVLQEYQGMTPGFSSDLVPLRASAAIREHLCHRAYLDAQESFTDWFHHFHEAKPVAPAKPADGEALFTELVAFDHRKKAYEAELERWRQAMNIQTKLVKQRLYNVLLFPEGGWLVDGYADGPSQTEEEAGRLRQMENLRQLCVPGVALLLLSVVNSMGEYAEALQLADVIVSEQHKLYKVYTKSKLQELLTKIGESCIPLMDQKKDAWGNPI